MPRKRKSTDQPSTNGGAEHEVQPPATVSGWRTWDKLKAKSPKMLWPGIMELGSLVALDGSKGLGKSTLATCLAAALTGGPGLPGCRKMIQGDVLWLCQEEDPETATLPRILAAGGDPRRIHDPGIDPLTGLNRRLYLPMDLDRLADQVRRVNARLIVIDPYSAVVQAGIPLGDEAAQHSVLDPLAGVMRLTGCTALLIRQMGKGSRGKAIDQGLGSAAIAAVCRSVLRIDEDPDEKTRRVLSVVRINTGTPAPSRRFSILSEDGRPRLEWCGECDYTADELAEAAGDQGERDARSDARAYLRDALKSGPVSAELLNGKAEAAGISRGTLRRAKRDLGVISRVTGSNDARVWLWEAPPEGFRERT